MLADLNLSGLQSYLLFYALMHLRVASLAR